MWKKEIIYDSATPVLYYLVQEKGELFLKHTYDCACENPQVEECFIVPSKNTERNKACRISAKRPFQVMVQEDGHKAEILFDGAEEEISVTIYPSIPHCDIMGNSISLDFENGKEFEEAVYQFYWRTLLPSVAERTAGAGYPVRDGYVVSTLQKEVYAGTYPDVDHEFQIKGRAAMADSFDLGLIRRMLELQLKLMAEDPEQLYRDPCALQPNGVREYHVRRNSKDLQTNAVMFLITGNVEIIESAWLYVAASKDWAWFERNKEGLENSLTLVEDCMDRQGRLWSDVYYEDQIIKDGRECMSAALAADAMRRMADLERRAGDSEKEKHYLLLERKLSRAMTADLPAGFWDRETDVLPTGWTEAASGMIISICWQMNCRCCSAMRMRRRKKRCRSLWKSASESSSGFPPFYQPGYRTIPIRKSECPMTCARQEDTGAGILLTGCLRAGGICWSSSSWPSAGRQGWMII